MARLPRPPRHNLQIPRTATGRRSPQPRRRESARYEHWEVPFVPWRKFLDGFTWQQGEHVTMIGPTGGGKTTLALAIIPKRHYMVTFATKAKDTVLYPELKRQGFQEVREWVPNADLQPKVLLRPPLKDTSRASRYDQAHVFEKALHNIYKDGGWGLYLDELRYITDTLRLQDDMELLYLQGRSLGVSIVGATQRPSWIPLVALSQATHLFLWRTTDRVDIDRVSGASGEGSSIVAATVPSLNLHEVLYVNTRTSDMARTKVEV